LERYQRVLNIDCESENQLFFKVGYSARKLLRHMMHKATFLAYRPSQIASTAILVAIDLNKGDMIGKKSTASFNIEKANGSPNSQSYYKSNGSDSKNVFDQMLSSNSEETSNTSPKGAVSPPSH
jgi:hypothetical protein